MSVNNISKIHSWELEFNKIGVESVQLLSDLAIKAYRDHYCHLWKDDNANWYVHKSFDIEPLTKELQDSKNYFYLVMNDHTPVGFLKLVQNYPLSIEGQADDKSLYLERIYFIKAVTGRGIGEWTMQKIYQQALEWRYESVWLAAMDSSDKAIAFYQRMGFETIGTKRLDFEYMKEEFRGMVIMKKPLSSCQ